MKQRVVQCGAVYDSYIARALSTFFGCVVRCVNSLAFSMHLDSMTWQRYNVVPRFCVSFTLLCPCEHLSLILIHQTALFRL